ncbi:alpha/beta hydrolase [Flavobacterium sp. MFBS3-15]|uniref:alpha/beta hydrolase n=1 Tax=Flavobacterium sp. MFBS3-15 TaxID=2989816 RepID=UPI002235CDAC|nr:alpha/beta hydrolase [Flavobacterium sp. MFBS3-15]MCW4470246.1 alpha/beta hydrolase [Flavobacterium sp. MFBS3-15]
MNEASINYWGEGQRVRESGQLTPETALAHQSLVLLIHGYNNDQDDALGAYRRFVECIKKNSSVNANLLQVFWPGSSWQGALYYMQAISQAKKVAPKLARDLCNAAKVMGYLKVDFVAHSLGCRLTLETMKALEEIRSSQGNLNGLVIGKVVFMAGAVPTKYISTGQQLRNALQAFHSALSLYSRKDIVLHYAFPAGQTAAGEGFFPIALGRANWTEGGSLYPPVLQKENRDAGHSDYWGKSDENLEKKEFAASEASKFLNLGALLPRIPDSRISDIRTITKRTLPHSREVKSRIM